MQNDKEEKEYNILPDLKHDTMEYAAPADGDDQLDIIEEEEITAGELDALEQTNDEEADALNAVQIDSEADEENFLSEPSEKDEFDEDLKDAVNI